MWQLDFVKLIFVKVEYKMIYVKIHIRKNELNITFKYKKHA
jgi:hypothetical protein